MQYCTECHSVEQGTIELTDNGNIETAIDVCAVCFEYDTMRNYNEDGDQER